MFQPVTLEWKGKAHTVPADRVMGLIAAVEDQVTLAELVTKTQEGRPPQARIAMGYAAALRYAGVKVEDQEVYGTLFANGASAEHMVKMATGLLMLMIPPDAIAQASAEGNAAGGSTPGKGSSKPRTKRS
jgi:hypothetical protein